MIIGINKCINIRALGSNEHQVEHFFLFFCLFVCVCEML